MTETGLKRHFTGDCARRICAMLGERAPGLGADELAAAVDARVHGLELKDRVLVIAEELERRLPGDYPNKIRIIVDSLGPELGEDQGMFTESWFLMPVARLVEVYGLAHPEESLAALEQITMRHTGEHALRPFLSQWHELTMEHVERWSHSPSHNVRRLSSEGIRPRLPWSARFKPFVADPRPVVKVVSALINDPSRYVRTSVANNLNDITKDHPDYAVDTAAQWLAASDTPYTHWIVRKGLRTLVKKGHPGALALLGAQTDPHIKVEDTCISPPRIQIGAHAEIRVVVRNTGTQPREVIVDYQVHYRKARGSLRPATFKLRRARLEAGQTLTLSKRHSFKELSTRPLYPGEHLLVAQANGSPGPKVSFFLSP